MDGDVFVRPSSAPGDPAVADLWDQPGWTIARKLAPVQQAVWQPVFDSRYAPLNPVRDSRAWYNPPWVGDGAGWTIDGPIYAHDSVTPTTLKWDEARPRYTDRQPPWIAG